MIDTTKFYVGRFHCKVNNVCGIGLRENVKPSKFKIDETIVLSNDEFRDFSANMLSNWNFLDGKGGTKCDLSFGGKTDIRQFTEKELKLYNNTCYRSALLITDNNMAVIVDPQGHSYARYSCLELNEIDEKDHFLLLQEVASE